jgi:menaquinol-cytochrome c reductase cytochrome b subunit
MNEAYFGQLIRGIHYWSANVLLAIIGLHMVQVFLSGAYKVPREVNWMLGVTLLLLSLGIAFTGYVLRWDQDGFWATVVGIKIGSYSPFVGSPVTHFSTCCSCSSSRRFPTSRRRRSPSRRTR